MSSKLSIESKNNSRPYFMWSEADGPPAGDGAEGTNTKRKNRPKTVLSFWCRRWDLNPHDIATNGF